MSLRKLLPFCMLLLTLAGAAAVADPLPRRAWLGAGFQPVSDSLRGLYPDSAGVRIVSVAPGGPAARAGLLVDDIVLTVGRHPVRTGPQVSARVKEHHKAGETIPVEFVRDSQLFTKDLTLDEWPRETPRDFHVHYEQFELDRARRRLIITRPEGAGPFPVVAMLGGIGCYSLDGASGPLNAYVEILYALTRSGFATVRIEKTGMGDSEGIPCAEQDFDFEVRGLVAGLRSLDRFDYIDSGNLILFGHSMGGLTAPVAAQEVPVKGIIAMATSAIGWFEYMMANQRRQLLLEGTPYDSIETMQAELQRALHLLYAEKQPPEDIEREHPELAAYLQAPAHYTFMQDVADLNIAARWKTLDVPVLFIYGSSDFVTSREEHLYGVNLVNHYHPGRAGYVEIDDLDHFFIRMPDQQASYANMQQGMPGKQMNRDAIPVIVNWCRRVAGLTDRRAVER